jgi:arylsulfatase A-like enzyme/predicted Zn-dependent protease
VIVVSLDTFRADRMAAYGGAARLTPNLDTFAESATVFLDATAPTPITLPSHATLFTGRYPTATGVRNNGSFVVREAETTLAETLHGAGWSTAAVVAAFPLHARYGLSQGFETYDDAFPEVRESETPAVPVFFSERPASDVTDRALAAWARMGKRPRFLWAHYFDAHAPYAPPEPFASRHADRLYDGEVAFVDAEFGRLLEGIRRESPNAWIVVTADHGESLGEHGEKTHGIFIYQSTVRVPLIIGAPGRFPEGARISEPVSLADVMPTVLDSLDLEIPPGVDGASLRGLAGGGPPPGRPVYAESYLPRLQFRFSELAAIRRGPLKYIEAPTPELYDLAADPDETRNLAAIHPDRADLAERLVEFVEAADPEASARATGRLDPEAEARLRSLGYAAAGTVEPVAGEERGRDPKTMVDYLGRYDRAVALNASGRLEEGIEILRALLPEVPENFMAGYQLAAALLAAGRLDEAAVVLRAVVEAAPEFSNGHLLRAEVEAQRGEIDEAVRSCEAAAATDLHSAEAHFAMGRLLESNGRFEAAGEAYLEGLRRAPDDREIARRLVELRAERGEIARAVADLRAIESAAPRAAGVRAALAGALRRSGEGARALEAAEEALRIDPASVDALLVSGEVLLDAGRAAEARVRLEAAERHDPARPDVQVTIAACDFALGRSLEGETRIGALLERVPRYAPAYRVRGEYLERTGNREGAVRAYRQALSLQPGDRGARAGLARLQRR